LTPDVVQAVRRLRFRRYLVIGRRTDVSSLDAGFLHADQPRASLAEYCSRFGRLARSPMDYFVFPRNTIGPLPEFAVGRPGWDNWMVYNARRRGIPVVDATNVVLAVHQTHGYAHVPKARAPHTYMGPEGDANLGLAGDAVEFNPDDATHALTARFLLPYLLAKPAALPHQLARFGLLHSGVAPLLTPMVGAVRRARGRS
jgi:hypothetical protein